MHISHFMFFATDVTCGLFYIYFRLLLNLLTEQLLKIINNRSQTGSYSALVVSSLQNMTKYPTHLNKSHRSYHYFKQVTVYLKDV